MSADDEEMVISLLKDEFEPEGIKVFSISAVSGKGIKERFIISKEKLDSIGKEPYIFEQEYFPEEEFVFSNEPFTVEYDEEEDKYVVEGPRIERMLGYTNLESEKGFEFFQKFLKDNGILDMLCDLGIKDGDTVKMYGLEFDYYK